MFHTTLQYHVLHLSNSEMVRLQHVAVIGCNTLSWGWSAHRAPVVNMINHTVKSCQITVLVRSRIPGQNGFLVRSESGNLCTSYLYNPNIFDILRFHYLNYIKLVRICHIRTYIGCRIGYPPKVKDSHTDILESCWVPALSTTQPDLSILVEPAAGSAHGQGRWLSEFSTDHQWLSLTLSQ